MTARLEHQTAELARSTAELEQFAYVASHDLQEPLRMVTSYVQLLGRRYRGRLDDDADEFIGFAVEGAVRMKQIISDLRSYVNIGRTEATWEAVEVTAMIERAVGSLRAGPLDTDRVELRHGDLPRVCADREQLGLVFQNLLANAVKFTAQAPALVVIGAEQDDDDWIFSVTDNGIGIETQYAERIFTLFQRLNARARYSGNGVGLSVCRRIVERHGGTIWVEPVDSGGSTFRFTIPARRQGFGPGHVHDEDPGAVQGGFLADQSASRSQDRGR